MDYAGNVVRFSEAFYKYSNVESEGNDQWLLSDGSYYWWFASKIKIVTIQQIKSRIRYMIDDWYVNNLAKI